MAAGMVAETPAVTHVDNGKQPLAFLLILIRFLVRTNILKRIVTSAVMLLPMFLFAQNEDDALRYSYYTPVGSARFSALGGAMGAVGADFGALSTNPASIGLYRRTEINVTPNFYFDNTGAKYYGSSLSDNKLNFNFSTIGGVFTSMNNALESQLRGKKLSTRERKKIKGWMSSSFAIGMNRLASFHQNSVIQGTNSQSSIANAFAANSQGLTPDQLSPFGEGLAYNTYLTDTSGSLNHYVSYVKHGGNLQRLSSESKGSINEIIFSYGANYNHKWYFGGTIGIPRIRYTTQSIYSENNQNDTLTAVEGFKFDSLRYERNNVVKGSGINLKLGFIYRVNDMWRFGFAFHTPSYLRITQNFESSMRTKFTVNNAPAGFGLLQSPLGQFTYNQVTPLRAIASVAVVFEKRGLLSLEYEVVPYGMNKLTSNSYDFKTENAAIRTKYATAGNIRFGGELRLSDRVAGRMGFAYLGNPFKSGYAAQTGFNVSAGIGYRKDGFFADFTYVLGMRKQDYYLYNSDLTAPANITTSTHNLLIGLGVRF